MDSDADDLYFQAWLSVINRCKRELDNDQLAEALIVTSLPDFRSRLDSLQAQHHYEHFAAIFVKMMKKDMNTSMMWGLLYLVVKVINHSPTKCSVL